MKIFEIFFILKTFDQFLETSWASLDPRTQGLFRFHFHNGFITTKIIHSCPAYTVVQI